MSDGGDGWADHSPETANETILACRLACNLDQLVLSYDRPRSSWAANASAINPRAVFPPRR